MNKFIICLTSFLLLSTSSFAQFPSFKLIPAIGGKGKTIDLTITGESLPPGEFVDLELAKGSAFRVPINNYQLENRGTATATVTLSESLESGSYDLIVSDGGTELVREEDAFQVVDERGLTEVTPNKGGRDETLEVEITGQNTNFGPATQTNIIFTQGTTTNANTASLKGINVINPSLVEGTLNLANSFDSGGYNVIYEKRGREVLKEESFFTVLKFPAGRKAKNPQKSGLAAKIYPNPFQGSFNLDVDIPEPMHLNAQLIDASGKVIKQVFDQQVSAGKQKFQGLSLSQELPSGSYFLKLKAQDGQFSEVIRLQKQ
jgi:hypothetical protein